MERHSKDFTGKLRLVELLLENSELDTHDSSLVKNKANFCLPQGRTVLWNLQFNFYKNKASTRKTLKFSLIFQSTNGKIF